ncbi:histone-like nucleoid-structuring protein Lsr2 [Nocardia goodfellowii]
MARKVVVTLVDDYDGKSKAEETVSFAVDGVCYEMDLSALNASQLRGIFQQWTPHARKVARTGRANRSKKGSGIDSQRAAAIRTWARKHGHKVSSRGRISAELATAYTAADH